MSGNPFRAGNRRPSEKVEVLHNGGESDDVVPQRKKDRVKKRVKIISPPQSPTETRQTLARRLSDGLTGSPPPPLRDTAEDDSSSDGEITTAAMDQAMQNTRRNSGSGLDQMNAPMSFGIHPNGTGSDAGGRVRAPYNPFARTLATTEAAFGLPSHGGDTTEEPSSELHSQPKSGRPVLDVDMFKDILLNGATVPATLGTPASASHPQSGGSKEVLPAPSRNSVFDSFAHPESPRMSWDHDRTYSDDEGDEGDESTTLMSLSDDTRLDTMAPPAPPKSKSGRAYPQTVSFADFDESIPSGFSKSANMAVGTQHPAGILRPQVSRSSSDLNKPLPRLPPGLQPSALSSAADAEPSQPSTALPLEQSVDAKLVPPPPPAARRQGQMNATPSQPRNSSGSSQQSLPKSDDPVVSSDNTTAKAAAPPPPPPPSRRAQATNTSTISLTDPARNPYPSSPDLKATPLPPPRRAGTRPGSTLSRTSSNASHRSGAPSDTAPPPLPPPRRDRGSKRSSTDAPVMRRPSDQRSRNGDSAGPDIEEVDETPSWEADRQEGMSVLKDLDALQAEIDALRVRHEGI